MPKMQECLACGDYYVVPSASDPVNEFSTPQGYCSKDCYTADCLEMAASAIEHADYKTEAELAQEDAIKRIAVAGGFNLKVTTENK